MKLLTTIILAQIIITGHIFALDFPAEELWRCDLERGAVYYSAPWLDDEGDVCLLITYFSGIQLICNGEVVWQSPQLSGTVTTASHIDFGDNGGERIIAAVMSDSSTQILEFYGDNYSRVIEHAPEFLYRYYESDQGGWASYDSRKITAILPLLSHNLDSIRTILFANDVDEASSYYDMNTYRENFTGMLRIYSLTNDSVVDSGNIGSLLDWSIEDIHRDGDPSYFLACNTMSGRTGLGGVFISEGGLGEMNADLQWVNTIKTGYCEGRPGPNYFALFPDAEDEQRKVVGVGFQNDPEAPVAATIPNLFFSQWPPPQLNPEHVAWSGTSRAVRFEDSEEEGRYALFPFADGHIAVYDVDDDEISDILEFEPRILDMKSVPSAQGIYDRLLIFFPDRVSLCSVGSLSVESREVDFQPNTLSLSAFPNPFNSSTTISYDIARPGFIRLGVYDTFGRLVGTVKEGYATHGSYRAVWNGEGLSSGSYVIKLDEPNGTTKSVPVQFVK